MDRLEEIVHEGIRELSQTISGVYSKIVIEKDKEIERLREIIAGAMVEIDEVECVSEQTYKKMQQALKGVDTTDSPELKEKRITDVKCKCPECRWEGTVGECEPDIDGDGSLGCPACFMAGAYVIIETEEESSSAIQKKQ